MVSRPGFAMISINEAIKTIKKENFIFESMFEGVLSNIHYQLNMRKPQAFTELNANLVLMLSGGIQNENYSEYLKLSDLIDEHALLKHFFYLVALSLTSKTEKKQA